MANQENIKPYAEFSHEAALHGGPEKYFNEYGDARYECGKNDQKEEDQIKMFIGLAGMALVCSAINWAYHKYSEFERKRTQENAEQAKETYLKATSENKMSPNENVIAPDQ